MDWGTLNDPQHYGEFKPRMSKPTAPICGTNKEESSFQHWEPANPKQTSRFGEPRVTQRATGAAAAAACLWGHWGTATSSPLNRSEVPQRPAGIAAIGAGSLPSEPTHRCAHTSSHRHSEHIATLQRRDSCLLGQISTDCLE